ncbi:ABC transporter ATP-binding protein [Cnuibacter physcomitrellae]|uniref:Uncharacterized protein n=1 Tax=Cnuibacter physcomitrellae TaxID=1619308 RepID=A0A1X9LHW6_9MICO|nr:ABC transporter ATP-binding protein [Cnuibacter physcomitrellae]ARJ04122.1 hypothetical protein B5808_01955 [Cnuibacter physcomitrellae]GGI40314.1 ABC transporter ATP-binding protein [Cnuibacter physcomitrellae]
MITARALRVRAGDRTLLGGESSSSSAGVDLDVPTGAVVGIVGPNGSGKSTLLRTLIRAVPLASGEVRVDGEDVSRLRRRDIARRVAFVGQHSDATDPTVTVADEVALGLVQRGPLGRDAADRAVADALIAMGVGEHARSPLVTLSGGERQRVALARAAAQRAPHALLDEPTNHLDIRHRLDTLAMLRRIAPTVVVVLHDLELAARFCDHIVLLDAGAVVASGPPDSVLTPAVLDPVYGVRTTVHREGDTFLFGFDRAEAHLSPTSTPPFERTSP